MNARILRLLIAVAVALVPSVAAAQHDAHQAAPSGGADMAQCAQVQPLIQNIVAAATARLESARQSNNPADMRAAIDSLESALRDIRTQLAPCAAAVTDPHAGHTVPNMQPAAGDAPAASSPAATAPDAHAGHQMPMPPPAPAGQPRGTTPSAGDPQAGHMGAHQTEKSAGKETDPINGLMVDPASAPKAAYQGQTYYFSSEASRKEFLQSPAKFARKPKQ